jgi:hypothetical protein
MLRGLDPLAAKGRSTAWLRKKQLLLYRRCLVYINLMLIVRPACGCWLATSLVVMASVAGSWDIFASCWRHAICKIHRLNGVASSSDRRWLPSVWHLGAGGDPRQRRPRDKCTRRGASYFALHCERYAALPPLSIWEGAISKLTRLCAVLYYVAHWLPILLVGTSGPDYVL